MAHDSLARYSKRWRSRTHSTCEVRFPIPINSNLFIWNASSRISWTLNAAFCHVTLPYMRTEGISAWELPSRYCSQYTFFWIAVRNYSTSECELPIHASYRTHQLSDYRASLTARFKQILIRLNNKFRIVTTKRVVVITRRLGKQAFHTRW